ncbi:hypothetical protein AB0I89_23825 [Micromonospora sp. NPDC049801]|uniref:hypothetical protein n=1 Tax=unclassified Micromonospora TaxID=2617518 RepID=UPI0033EF96B3
MARLIGPDAGSRQAQHFEDGTPAAEATAVVYANAAGTVLADIRTYDGSSTPGGAILNSRVITDSYGQLPPFWFPDGADRVWVRIGEDGPVWPVDADNNARFDGPFAVVDPQWEPGRPYRYGYWDSVYAVDGWDDASGASTPSILYSKMFGGTATKTGDGNIDAHWASIVHRGPGEAGLFIGDVTAPSGAAGGNLWGGHFRLQADVAASLQGLHVDLVPNAAPTGKQTIGVTISNASGANQLQQAVRITGKWENPVIVYSDAAGLVPIWWIDNAGGTHLAGMIYVGTGASAPTIRSGSGSPQSVVTAPVGSLYMRTDGSNGQLWVKGSGTGNTGWTQLT